MTKYLPLAAVLAFAGIGFALPRPEAVGRPDVIRIVSSLPRSGSAKGQTDSIVDGITLALLEVGHKVTVGGKEYTVEYTDLDDATAAAGAWTADAEIANANLAVRDPDVMVYIGTYNSAAARISMPILNRARMLMVSPANTSEKLTKPGFGDRSEPDCYRPRFEVDENGNPILDADGKPKRWVNFVRVVPTDDLQGSLSADWADDMRLRRVYILDDNETYGKGVADQFEKKARENGLTILGHESIDNKSPEFNALMTKVKALAPDLIYFGGTTQSKAGQLVKDMVSAGLTAKFMAPDGCYEKVMIRETGPERLIGRFYVTFTGLTPDRLTDGKGKEFFDKHVEVLGKEPREAYAIYGYESGLVALEALRRAGVKDRAAVCRAGRTIKDFVGPSGLKWAFDENGDTTLQLMTGSTVQMTDKGPDFRAVKDLIPRTTPK